MAGAVGGLKLGLLAINTGCNPYTTPHAEDRAYMLTHDSKPPV